MARRSILEEIELSSDSDSDCCIMEVSVRGDPFLESGIGESDGESVHLIPSQSGRQEESIQVISSQESVQLISSRESGQQEESNSNVGSPFLRDSVFD